MKQDRLVDMDDERDQIEQQLSMKTDKSKKKMFKTENRFKSKLGKFEQ